MQKSKRRGSSKALERHSANRVTAAAQIDSCITDLKSVVNAHKTRRKKASQRPKPIVDTDIISGEEDLNDHEDSRREEADLTHLNIEKPVRKQRPASAL